MVAMGHSPVAAQSFQGTVLGTPTNATVNNSVPGQTTVTVTAPTAIVNWQPTDTAGGTAPITFQDAGTTATFDSSGGDYTVLNRILPTGAASGRSVLLNGTINSFIGNAAANQRGGAVWFYSPNGLIVGSQASIDVGSLLLTTRDLDDAEFLAGNGVYNFGAADDSRSSVTIQAGAQINAASILGSSYVAIVAPRIVQAGAVRVDGSAAYVAAEQATITINSSSLFDIQVQSGSAVDAGTPGDEVTLSHTGSTGGPASTAISDPQSIYMVAIPKNVAITMLVGGDVGYDASVAAVQNGQVVLSAGSNVALAGGLLDGPASGVGANLTIDGGSFTSSTRASARTDAVANGGAGGSLAFSDDFSLSGGASATLTAADGDAISVGGALSVQALNLDDAGNRIRGTAAITVGDNATLTVGGSTSIDASVFDSGDVQGGFASLSAGQGASLQFQALSIVAGASSFSADAQGGDASLSLTGAALTAQSVTVSAYGSAGGALDGGDGSGGNAGLTVTDSTLVSGDTILVEAEGYGGGGDNGGTGGIGTGGIAEFDVTGTTALVQAGSNIEVTAAGFGGTDNTDGVGDGVNGGEGRGGTAVFTLSDAGISASLLSIDASGTGGGGLSSDAAGVRGGAAGGGTGGTATANLATDTIGISQIDVLAVGSGGDGGAGFEIPDEFGYGTGASPDGGDAGFGVGGSAGLTIDGAFDAGSIEVNGGALAGVAGSSDFGVAGSGADALGGNATLAFLTNAGGDVGTLIVTAAAAASDGGPSAGNAIGGNATISSTSADIISFAESSLDASATGGSVDAAGASAGNATGGTASLLVDSGGLSLGAISFDASGNGGNAIGGIGGDGLGGMAMVDLASGASDVSGSLTIAADGIGGFGSTAGGSGDGGLIDFSIGGGGSLSIGDGSLFLSALGRGSGTSEIQMDETGGDASGGNITLAVAGSLSTIALNLDTSAEAGSSYGIGGDADGGTIALNVGGGDLQLSSSLNITTEGRAGSGITGGDATGGAISITFSGDGDLTSGGALNVYANAFGGDGGYSGDGGDATGGNVDFTIADASTGTDFEVGYGVQFEAQGFGGRSTNQIFGGTGAGGSGGDGTGGSVAVRAGNATVTAPFSVNLSANGSGGSVLDTGGDGGAGHGGDVTLDLGGSALTTGDINLSAGAIGADAAEFGYGSGGDGGDATAGSARLLLAGGSIVAGNVSINASAVAGSGGDGNDDDVLGPVAGGAGGNATGGTASIDVDGGSLAADGSVGLDVGVTGGNGGLSFTDTAPGIGGMAVAGGADGTGGATVALGGGATLSASTLLVLADASGGRGGYSLSSTMPVGADGGNAFGGLASMTVTGSVIDASQTKISARGIGGDADYGDLDAPPALSGSGTGGTAELAIDGGDAGFDTLSIDASAIGGGFSLVGTGNALGGTARLTTSGGSLGITESFFLSAAAESQIGIGQLPTVTGGTAEFSASDGTAIDFGPGNLTVDAGATLFGNESESSFFSADTGGFSLLALDEGGAAGGTASFSLDGVTLDLSGNLTLDAGGYAEAPGISAQGGTASLAVSNGAALSVTGALQLLATGSATDGDVSGSGQGGDGFGGSATFLVAGSSLMAGDILVDARGTGGASTLLAPGGSGTGGDISIEIAADGDSSGSVNARSLTAQADGTGGSAIVDTSFGTSGSDGGAGTGGTVAMRVGGGLTLEGGEGGSLLTLSANGVGGDAFAGGMAGAGIGGSTSLATEAPLSGTTAILADGIALSANGTGGTAIDPASFTQFPSLDLSAASGGDGMGGSVTLTGNAGIISTAAIMASATGAGQNGVSALTGLPGEAGGNGGNGTGGSFTLALGGGELGGPLSTSVNAVAGSGGNGGTGGAGGDGGDATAGAFAINLVGDGQSFDLPGGLALDLGAVAGNGGDAGDADSGAGANGGAGGNAVGGNLSLATAGNGGSLSLGSLDLIASATGGNGGLGGAGTTAGISGDGGNGAGGSIDLAAGPGTLTLGDTDVQLDGRGGDGGGIDGSGGNGIGGMFAAQATGGSIAFGALSVSANGLGGNGGASGDGGDGAGGRIRLATSDGPGGEVGGIMAGDTSLVASGSAGSGLNAGATTAGRIDILQQSASATGAIRFASLDATALGSAADSETSAINLLADGGTIAVTGQATLDAAGFASLTGVGTGVIDIGGALTVSAGDLVTIGGTTADAIALASGGDIVFNGDVTGDSGLTAQATDGSIEADGAVTITGGAGTGGLLQLLSSSGIDAPDASLVTGGTAQFHLGDGDFIVGNLMVGDRIDTLDATSGITDFGRLVTVGAIRIAGSTMVGGAIDFQAGTDIALGDAVAGNDLNLAAGGSVVAASLQAGDDILVSGASIDLGAATTTGLGLDDETGYGGDGLGNVALFADAGIIATDISAFGDVTAQDGSGGIAIDTLLSGGGVSLSSTGGAVTVATDLAADGPIDASGTDVTLRAFGSLLLDSLTATAGNVLVETGGAISAAGVSAQGDVTATSGAGIDLSQVDAGGSIMLEAGGEGAADVRLVDASAGEAIQVTAQGTATLGGTVDAPVIEVASRDIAIVEGDEGDARIGVGTDRITLSNVGPLDTRVGGGDVADAWSLSNDEFGRLSAHTITIAATGQGGSGDMSIGALDIIGAAGSDTASRRRNLTGSDLILSAAGSILVDGAVALTDAGDDDRLTLSAGDRIMVDTSSGSISLTGQGNALGGTLALEAPTIFAGTADAWADISALTDIAAKDARLADNDGIVNPEGFLRANAMTFSASQGIYIQNSGADDVQTPGATSVPGENRAGFTVGTGGVTIIASGAQDAPLEIVLNGRQALADGTFATGADLIPLLQISGEGSASMASFDPGSTANGCLIVGVSCSVTLPDQQTGIPQQDIINLLEPDEDFDGETGLIQSLNTPIIQFAETLDISSDPVVDEPVTGTANENLWLGDGGDGGSDIGQQVTGTRNDDDEPETENGQQIDEQVTGTRNDNLDEPVTGTRNDSRDEPRGPNPQ